MRQTRSSFLQKLVGIFLLVAITGCDDGRAKRNKEALRESACSDLSKLTDSLPSDKDAYIADPAIHIRHLTKNLPGWKISYNIIAETENGYVFTWDPKTRTWK